MNSVYHILSSAIHDGKSRGQRLPNVSFNVEFFSHRMDSDAERAHFAAEHAERFRATAPAEVAGHGRW